MSVGLTKDLDSLSKDDVGIAGGKGASLGEMTKAGISVPPGFVVLASAFDRFLEETDLKPEVEAQLEKVNYEDVSSVERASRVIHDLIHDVRFPEDLKELLLVSCHELDAAQVAVRSSATVEDSSVASWAGELESCLNTTEETLLDNVKKCWASLFTPRAIFYRNEKGMRDTRIRVAVVIQKMVQSEVAGIAFTVHPITKDVNQMIIEACWGLGEMIVGGRVTPDSYVVDKRDGKLIDVNIADQEKMMVRGAKGNDEIAVPSAKRAKRKLDAAQIRELGDICRKIEDHFGFPCDIEWGMEAGRFYVLQSRPITTL